MLAMACCHGEDDEQGFSRDAALTLGRTHDGRELGTLWFEKGQSSEPYRHAGTVILKRGAHASYQAPGMARPWGIGVNPGACQTRLDFFTGADGGAWLTAHSFKPEIEVPDSEAEAEPLSERQKALGPAARLAITENDVEFLKQLIERGLDLNASLDSEEPTTALYEAVWERSPQLVEFLLEQGADRDLRGRDGERPIELAIEWKLPEIRRLLAMPGKKDAMIAGVPEGVLDEIFQGDRGDRLHFIVWGGEDPPQALLEWLKKRLPNARPASRMETLETRPLGAPTWYRDPGDGRFGRLLEVSVKPDGDAWTARVRDSSGPFLAGGGWEARYTRTDGYWIGETTSSWDE